MFRTVLMSLIVLWGVQGNASVPTHHKNKTHKSPPHNTNGDQVQVIEMKSETSRQVRVYAVQRQLPPAELKKMTDETLSEMVLSEESLEPKKMSKIAVDVKGPFYLVVERLGKRAITNKFGPQYTQCGPVTTGDRVTIATKKTLGKIDRGTKCHIARGAFTPHKPKNPDQIIAFVEKLAQGKGAVLQIIHARDRKLLKKRVYLHADKIAGLTLGAEVILQKVIKKAALSRGCASLDSECQYGVANYEPVAAA